MIDITNKQIRALVTLAQVSGIMFQALQEIASDPVPAPEPEPEPEPELDHGDPPGLIQ